MWHPLPLECWKRVMLVQHKGTQEKKSRQFIIIIIINFAKTVLAGRCKAGSEIKTTSQLPETLVPGKLVPSSGLSRNSRDASKTSMQLNTNFYNLCVRACVRLCKTQSQFLSTQSFGFLFLMEVTLSNPIYGNSTQSDMID